MRSDTNLNKRFDAEGIDTRQYGSMPGVLDTNTKVQERRVLRSHSFSGNETNSVFLNQMGQAFADVSGLSGSDSLADGRAFAYFDYDHDGRTDIVLTNSNNPQLQLFRNEMRNVGNAVHLRLIGGNQASAATKEWSPRDGYGTHVVVELGDQKLRRELRCGDGFAAQNSRTLTIGIGQHQKADQITIEWTSGKRSHLDSLSAGWLATVHENQAEAAVVKAELVKAAIPQLSNLRPIPIATLNLTINADLAVVTTMATWCPVCAKEIPHLARLARATNGAIRFYGLPIDPEDDGTKLATYQKDKAPPYQILHPSDEQRNAVLELMQSRFADQPLPTTFVIDRSGNVLHLQKGIPTVSQLRLLIQR
ncbi:MAG: ASPIC/UnbV domain-containing protein [Verrucomicrobia bacterium]|nr:ASPIC/UnbV domain-containing protein [Verrucomicrobiota bacterium]